MAAVCWPAHPFRLELRMCPSDRSRPRIGSYEVLESCFQEGLRWGLRPICRMPSALRIGVSIRSRFEVGRVNFVAPILVSVRRSIRLESEIFPRPAPCHEALILRHKLGQMKVMARKNRFARSISKSVSVSGECLYDRLFRSRLPDLGGQNRQTRDCVLGGAGSFCLMRLKSIR